MRTTLPLQKQPNIFASFKAGYQTVSKHLGLILFPITLDLFLLFGVRITLGGMMQGLIDRFTLPASATADVIAGWNTYKAQLSEFFRFFSLTSFLRSFPIGVPSLFSVAAFETNPLGKLRFVELRQPNSAFLLIFGFSLLGLLLAFILYRLIANATANKPREGLPFIDFPSLLAWLLIPLASILLLFIVILPVLLLVSLIGAAFPAFTTIGYFLLTLAIISFVTPVFFTPHLIVQENLNFPQALLTSFRAVRLTNAKSTTFIFIAILINYLTNMLWRIPQDNSWMLLVSILGHSLISIITLTASFHYISDARARVIEFDKNQMSENILA